MADTYNADSDTFLNGTNDNDSIYNSDDNVIINTGDGNDTVENAGVNVTIYGGKGRDRIQNFYGGGLVYVYNGGNDYIEWFGNSDTLVIPNGTWSISQQNEFYATVCAENGSIVLGPYYDFDEYYDFDDLYDGNIVSSTKGIRSIKIKENSNDAVLIRGTGYKDSILNSGSNVTIDGGADNDSIQNDGGSFVTISGGKGKDSLRNENGSNLTIQGGAGNDSLENVEGSNVTMNGGAGNDYLCNYSGNTILDGGEGKDTIRNWSNNVKIFCGVSNDTILNNVRDDFVHADDVDGGNNVLFNYTSGDGKDIIYGFNETSTLSISGGSYSTKKSGDNIIVTVDDGKISLIGASISSSKRLPRRIPNVSRSPKATTPTITVLKARRLTRSAAMILFTTTPTRFQSVAAKATTIFRTVSVRITAHCAAVTETIPFQITS